MSFSQRPDNNNVKDGFYRDNKDPQLLTSRITKVDNSKEESPSSRCKTQWPPGRAASEDDGAEVISLTEIICEGKALRLQAESLLDSGVDSPLSRGWQGGFFKRLLVGAGILTGAGVLGYQCYAGRESIAGQKANLAQPYPKEPPVNPFIPFYDSSGMRNNSLSNVERHRDSTHDEVRHRRRHVPQSPGTQRNYLVERQLMEKEFIKIKSDIFIFKIIAEDLSALKEINERHRNYLQLVISNTVNIVDSAITSLLRSSNRYNTIRPVIDDYLGRALLRHLDLNIENIKISDYKNYFDARKVFEEQIKGELKQPFLVDIIHDKVFIDKLIINLAKMRNYLARGCDRYDNNCLNFIYVNKKKDTKIFEKENSLSPLIATIGDQILPKIGYDKLDIIITEDFFKLCTVDASNVIVHELAHYFTATTDFFEIKRESNCEKSPATATNHSSVIEQLSFAEERLSHLKDDIESYISNNWGNISIQIEDILARIPSYPAEGVRMEQINIFLEYYRNHPEFRKNINHRATDYYSNLIIALASQQFKHDGKIPLSAVERLKDS
ncbi:hypothetical protein ETA_31340 [Erwinia tasmaniensis Et1/99]|uniref:Uncharacterized protein n=2 Tax=Erwinia tasmaniensis TaxID=338565 RepID=B2VK67_ERWT9|nr:hypothetical protein ETA_31340 [Erwinia tasmaniensis Et1/99]